MTGIFASLGDLLKGPQSATQDGDTGPSAMELAMQAAIEKHAADKASGAAAALPDGADHKLVKPKSGTAVFGRRASATSDTIEFRAVD